MAASYHHSTSRQAAQVARASNVKALYLTHISARYMGRDAKQLEDQARRIFEGARLVYDFDEFDVIGGDSSCQET